VTDPLSAAKGIGLAVLLSIPIWVVIFASWSCWNQAFGASQCRTVKSCHAAIRWQKHDRARLARRLVAKTHVDVVAAIRLAANVSGVSFSRLWTISGCESNHDPYAVTGQYQGLFQLGTYHRSFPEFRGLSPFNAYANAIHAALFIAKHGESQWSCRSNGSVAY
jgi:hypothetical protein